MLLVCMGLIPVLMAQTKVEADSAYGKEMYDKAIQIYSALLKQGESAAIYYNLGNCYYKKDSIAKAVLNYERAALIEPGDGNIRFNLELARSKTIDKIIPESEMFFITWYRALVNVTGVDGWAYIAVGAFLLMLLSFAFFLFTEKILLKKIGFFSALGLLFVVIFSNIFAYQQRLRLSDRKGAIIMESSVVVKSTPNESGTDLFVLHEGTRVEIIDNTMKDWKEIRLADGKVGWMRKEQMEII